MTIVIGKKEQSRKKPGAFGETKFEINGPEAYIHIPPDVDTVRLFIGRHRVEIIDTIGDPVINVSRLPRDILKTRRKTRQAA